METIFAIWLGVTGVCIGSFLNVVIARVPNDESISNPPRSKCPKCQHQLTWAENIPVVSWLMLRGKCSHCGLPISPRYLFVELLTGALYLLLLNRIGMTYALAPALFFVTVLIPLVFIDAEHWILPLELMIPGAIFGVLFQLPNGRAAVINAVLGVVVGFFVFRALEFFGWLFTKQEAMGAGDKFLVAMIGAYLGWHFLLGVFLLSALQASMWGLGSIALTGRAGPGAPTPEPAPTEPAPAVDPSAPPADPTAQVAKEEEDEGDAPRPWSPACFAPGLPLWKRFALIPYVIVWQDIPDPEIETDAEGNEVDVWEPGVTNLPYGPWLGLAAVEVMLFSQQLANVGPQGSFTRAMLRTVFGA